MAKGNSSPKRGPARDRCLDAADREAMERFIASWLELPTPVRLRQNSRAKSVILRVAPDRGLEITAPAGFDLATLPLALREKQAWIEEQVLRLLEIGALPGGADVPRPERLALTAFDRTWRLNYLAARDGAASGGCRLTEKGPGELVVSGAVGDGPAVTEALTRFVRSKAGPLLVAELRATSRRIGLPFASARVREQRTRWGSCSARKTISLNLRLAFLPPRLARYVFIHELCHTRHLNHSKAFWDLTAACEPDFKRLDRALRHAEEYVPLWLRLGVTAP